MSLIDGWINNKAIDEIEDNILNAEAVYFADAISKLVGGLRVKNQYPSKEEKDRILKAIALKLPEIAKHL